MLLAYGVRSMVWVSEDMASSAPPAKKLVPRVVGPGSVSTGYPPAAPYWMAVASPTEVQPGAATAVPSIEPIAASASPFTMRFAVFTLPDAAPEEAPDEEPEELPDEEPEEPPGPGVFEELHAAQATTATVPRMDAVLESDTMDDLS